MGGIIFLNLSLYAWITIITVLAMFAVLLFTKTPAEMAFLSVPSLSSWEDWYIRVFCNGLRSISWERPDLIIRLSSV